MILDALKEETESRLWQQWLVEFSRMDESNFISWEKYKEDAFKKPEVYDAKKIIADAEEIKQLDQSNMNKHYH